MQRRHKTPQAADIDDCVETFDTIRGGVSQRHDATDLESIEQEARDMRQDLDAYADRINGRGDRHSIDIADE